MTIRQLPVPCFAIEPNPWGEDGSTPHYPGRAEAEAALRERRDELTPDPDELAKIADCRTVHLNALCWVAECDAPDGLEEACGDRLGGEDTGSPCIHFATREELVQWMPGEKWICVGLDSALCRDHRPTLLEAS